MTIDFQTPFDPTAYVTISGAQLQQFVSGLAPQAYIGWNIVTTDDNAGNPSVPNAITEPKLQAYSWIRRAKNGSAILYVWNPSSAIDATYLNWQQANISSIVTGSITGAQIAGQTITGTNIALNTIPWGCIVAGATVGGCLTGSLPNPALAANVVAAANIVLGCITGGNPSTTSQLADATIQGRNITAVDANAIKDQNIMSIAQAGGGLLSTGATGKIQLPAVAVAGMVNRVAVGALTWESILNQFVKDLSGDVLTGNASKHFRVKSDVSGLEVVSVPFNKSIFTATSAQNMANAANGTSGTTSVQIDMGPHGLGGMPTFVRAVLVCTADDATVTKLSGDEVPIESCLANSASAKSLMSVYVGLDGHVYWSINSAAFTGIRMLKNDGTAAVITYANWKVKVYAVL